MQSVPVPIELLLRVVKLADGFGEPNFMVIVGDGDGGENGVEGGRVAVLTLSCHRSRTTSPTNSGMPKG